MNKGEKGMPWPHVGPPKMTKVTALALYSYIGRTVRRGRSSDMLWSTCSSNQKCPVTDSGEAQTTDNLWWWRDWSQMLWLLPSTVFHQKYHIIAVFQQTVFLKLIQVWARLHTCPKTGPLYPQKHYTCWMHLSTEGVPKNKTVVYKWKTLWGMSREK